MFKNSLKLIPVCALTLACLVGCGSMAKTQQATYSVAYESYPPFAFTDETGNVVGFDKDLLDEIGKNQGFKVQFFAEKWDGIFNLLNDKSRDIVASGVSVNSERKETMDFSSPYISDTVVILVNGKPELKTLQDFKNKNIAVQSGSSKVKKLEQFFGKNSPHIKKYESTKEALTATLSGEVDGVIAGESNLRYQMMSMSAEQKSAYKVRYIKYPSDKVSYTAFALQKNREDDLLKKINLGLAEMKQKGTYQKIYEKWFGQ